MPDTLQQSSSLTASANNMYDWSRFTKRINIKAPPQELYSAWTTKGGMEKWFLRLSEFKRPDGSLLKENDKITKGDTYRWLWHGWPDTTMEQGEILQTNGKDFLHFSFGVAGNVSIKIIEEEGEQIVELTQDNIPTDEKNKVHFHIGCMEGWTFYLTNLKSIMEGGIDLRNKNEKLQKVINS